ncbi:hypothetical protein IIU_06736 [Bacillus cereus VD133]|uniref:PA14 domain-containing protein n=1 Tax=Bacillus cereus VD133 TaxID=1053233 RepID=A0A9W5UZ40_BACCE|nr:binary toxin-like calcium binding domain-containing protein [Bacillus cereus]EOO24383.1 hypothetical protein IIU_06736 [Bacillus cereus VD133]
MNIKSVYKVLATTVVVGQLLAGPAISHADTQKTNPKHEQQQKKAGKTGLLANYYSDASFQHKSMFTIQSTGNFQLKKEDLKSMLPEDKQNFQSASWTGYIKPSKGGEYLFTTSDDQQAAIQIDGKTIISSASMKEKIKLEKDKLYPIVIQYHTDKKEGENPLLNFKLSWSIDGGKSETIPEKNLILPNMSEEKTPTPFVNLFANTDANVNFAVETDAVDKDSDGDGILDDWEINGYTVDKGLVVKWEDALHKDKGFKKFKSDPMNKHTTGDPFIDFEKVVGAIKGTIDGGILPEALNPIVAAAPKVVVNSKKIIMTKNLTKSIDIGSTTTDDTSHTVGTSTSNTHSESNTVGASASASFPWGVSVSANYSHDWTDTATRESNSSDTTGHSQGKSWSSTLGLNTGEAAYLNGNIQYLNVGTAPIYHAKPTVNIQLGNDVLKTIKAGSGTTANVINPGASYPESGAIAWTTDDDFSAHPITMRAEQVDQFEKGTPMSFKTTQSDGSFVKYDGDGNMVDDEQKQQWTPYLKTIESRTADITFDLGEDKLKERQISARKAANYDQQTQPEVTVGEAIEAGFPGAKIDDKGNLSYEGFNGQAQITMDQKTYDDLHAQLEKMPENNRNMMNAKLHQGMNILITPKPADKPADKPVVAKKEGWVTDNGKKFYFGKDGDGTGLKIGEMAHNWQTIEGKKYFFAPVAGYFNDSGDIWHDNTNKAEDHASVEGEMATGPQQIGTAHQVYYFGKNGDGTGLKEGEMAIGWTKIGEKWFYCVKDVDRLQLKNYVFSNHDKTDLKEGEIATGWINLGEKWYYLGEFNSPDLKIGEMATRSHIIYDNKYDFNDDGTLKGVPKLL